MPLSRPIAALLFGAILVNACSESTTTAPTTPLATCTQASTVIALAAGQDTVIDPAATDSGCVSFAANASTSDSAEYLVVAQSAGGIPGDTASFSLSSATLTASASIARAAAVAVQRGAPQWLRGRRGRIPSRFDRFLRSLERSRSPAAAAAARAQIHAPRRAVVRPSVGDLRTFSVCANYDCTSFKAVGGKVRSLGAHVAIYVDTLAPTGGLAQADLDSLQQVFDDHVYAVDTAAFGGLSDVDGNGVVIVLMTPVVNAAVTAAACEQDGFIAGFFFPPDLDPTQADQYNDGEIFYTIVGDPGGLVSCSHTVADVKQLLPGTFLHELQHVISFNQHVLVRGGEVEDLWLDEALSSLAEELGGRSFLPNTTTFGQYVIGDLFNAYSYLSNPGGSFLLQASDTVLADFGAGWLYLRYLVDQFGPTLTNRLEQTALIGTANVAAQTGLPFATTVARWAFANWVSDLPGYSAPATLSYSSWSFRSVFASFNAEDPADFPVAFPLILRQSAGSQVSVSGVFHAGSGYYVDIRQPPSGAVFTLRLTDGSAAEETVMPRLAVLRLR